MPIVVVGGSTKDIGKTALMCALIAALKDLAWTAVKITAHRYGREDSSPRPGTGPLKSTVWEETTAGEGTDTARYLAAGARRALLVTRNDPEAPFDEIRSALRLDRNVIFESNRIMDVMEPDVCLALLGGGETEMKPSFARLLGKADVLVSLTDDEVEIPQFATALRRFQLQSLDRLTPEMVEWLRERLRAIG